MKAKTSAAPRTSLIGKSVLYTPTADNAETLARTRGITQPALAAIVTGQADDRSVTLFVMPPGSDPFHVSGVSEGDDGEPHTCKHVPTE